MNLKRISFKYLNLSIFVSLVLLMVVMYIFYNDWCIKKDIYCNYRFYDTVYNPLYFGGRIFTVIIGLFLFVPSSIFKKWVLYIAIPWLLLTWYVVQGISVYSGGVLYMSRAQTAENSMYVLGIISVIFVTTYFVYIWHKAPSISKPLK